jgi:hypothetical protein
LNQTLVVDAPGVLGNDSASSGQTLTAGLQTPPNRGSVTLNPDGSFRFTPGLNFLGTVTWQYYAIDGVGGRAVGTVTMTVNRIDINVLADSYAVGANHYLNVAAPGLLVNDSDPGGNTLSVRTVTQPANGSLVGYTDGSFSYLPDAGFVGTDQFTYQAGNGLSQGSATVDIVVTEGGGGDAVQSAAPAGADAAAGSLPKLPVVDVNASLPGTSSATAPDLKVTAMRKRTASRSWRVVGTVKNVGNAATTARISLVSRAAKGVTVKSVRAPKGWTCKKAKQKWTCTTKKVLAPTAKAVLTYTVKTTKGARRTLRLSATTVGDTVARNNTVLVKVPAKA